jgi:NTE family protein
VRARRKIELVDTYKRRDALLHYFSGVNDDQYRILTRQGAYWRMADDLNGYKMPSPLSYPVTATQKLAAVATRLAALDLLTQRRLVNFGYAACDVHMRKYVAKELPAPVQYPYPAAGVG